MGEVLGWFVFLAIIVGIILGAYYFSKQSKKRKAAQLEQRRQELMKKYNDVEVVTNIMNKNIWIGETADMLLDSMGPPVATDQKILKTKKKEVWKYGHQGANRYNVRITLDNDEVVQWDVKE